MDKEQARFILQSFRPDGADAQDPDFAEALSVAAEDRELGAWLAVERAQDSAFAAALSDVEIPDDLRQNILGVLSGGSPEPDYADMDAAFVGALASVRPPDGLRDQILSAMTVEERDRTSTKITSIEESAAKPSPKRVWNWLSAAAVAAVVALGAFLAIQVTGGNGNSTAKVKRSTVEHQSIALVSGSVKLDKQAQQPAQLVSYLESKGIPTPSLEHLPKGLLDASGIGCKVVKIGEKNAALICFDKKGVGVVHLVVIDRNDVGDDLPTLAEAMKGCWQCPNTEVSVAAWEADDDALFLLGKMPEAKLVSVF